MWLKAFLQKRREASKMAKFEAGYDWTAGNLLSRRMSEEAIESYINNPFDRDEFDNGAALALREYRTLKAAPCAHCPFTYLK